MLGRYLGVAPDADRLRREVGRPGQNFGDREVLRAARRLGLRARAVKCRLSRLSRMPLPALARCRDGRYLIIARVADDRILVHDPAAPGASVIAPNAFVETWSGGLILVARRAHRGPRDQRFGLGWFVSALARYRGLLAEMLVASLFLQLFGLLTPLFFQVVVDKVLVHRGVSTLDVLTVGMAALTMFEVLLAGLRAYLFTHTSSRLDVELGTRLFGHLMALPLAYFEARPAGDTIARVRELETVRQFLMGSPVTLVIDVSFTGVFVAVMLWYSRSLTLVVLALLPAYVLLSLVATPLLRSRLAEKFDRGAESQAFLVECVAGVGTVKSLALEPEMRRRWEEHLAAYVRSGFQAANLAGLAGQVASLLNKLGALAVLWVGAHAVMAGALSVGELIAFNMLAGRVSGPVLRLVQLWQDFQQVGISVRRLADLLDAPEEFQASPSRPTLPSLAGRVAFHEVSFRYRPGTPPVLSSVSFHVAPGEVIAVIGRSGSGKSTLAKLIQRLYVPEAGRVSIDGVDVSQLDPAWLRRRVGVVLQDSLLFNRSVRDNIAASEPALSLAHVVNAARLAGAHDFILELNGGYDAVVGERGAALSGGQRQRIALARALTANPTILILDEVTSALDYESERLFLDNLPEICRGRTVFIIAHRLSVIRFARRVLVLDRGRVVEDGAPEDLLRAGGFYARLHALQNVTRSRT